MRINSILRTNLIFSFGSLFLLCLSCDKHNVPPAKAKLKISVIHHFNHEEIDVFNVFYIDEAGDSINFTDLKYYISNVKLVDEDGSVFRDSDIFYVNLEDPMSCILLVDSIPPGNYKRIYFDLGIDDERNHHGLLPATIENINMEWPDLMGGGYHFLKLEGQFKLNGNFYGYAFHLGKNSSRIEYMLNIDEKYTYWNEELNLYHDVCEWFKNPLTYDFSIHEPYSMNSDSVMGVLKLNGFDVFSI